jgi:hypothetical protein
MHLPGVAPPVEKSTISLESNRIVVPTGIPQASVIRTLALSSERFDAAGRAFAELPHTKFHTHNQALTRTQSHTLL